MFQSIFTSSKLLYYIPCSLLGLGSCCTSATSLSSSLAQSQEAASCLLPPSPPPVTPSQKLPPAPPDPPWASSRSTRPCIPRHDLTLSTQDSQFRPLCVHICVRLLTAEMRWSRERQQGRAAIVSLYTPEERRHPQDGRSSLLAISLVGNLFIYQAKGVR